MLFCIPVGTLGLSPRCGRGNRGRSTSRLLRRVLAKNRRVDHFFFHRRPVVRLHREEVHWSQAGSHVSGRRVEKPISDPYWSCRRRGGRTVGDAQFAGILLLIVSSASCIGVVVVSYVEAVCFSTQRAVRESSRYLVVAEIWNVRI